MIVGAVLGAVGSIVTKGLSIFESRQQAKIDERRRADEIQIAQINAEGKTQVASYRHDNETGTASQIVIDILRLVRPAITFYALGLITLFWFHVDPAGKSVIVTGILDLASMSVAWWFGSRRIGT